MTLSDKYDEVMDRIKVDADMRGRVLAGISSAMRGRSPSRTLSRAVKYISIAACAAAAVLAAVIAPRLTHTQVVQPESEVYVVPQIEEASDLNELMQLTGLEIRELKTLPFELQSKSYVSFWSELAEIDYVGVDNQCIYRISKAEEDNSGNYEEFANTEELDISGIKVTLKGDADDSFKLALWQSDEYSYSIQLENAISREDITGIISAWADN